MYSFEQFNQYVEGLKDIFGKAEYETILYNATVLIDHSFIIKKDDIICRLPSCFKYDIKEKGDYALIKHAMQHSVIRFTQQEKNRKIK